MTSPPTPFRRLLALRATASMTVAVGIIAVACLVGFGVLLDRELKSSVMAVASIQASSVTDSPDGEMHFHEWELSAEEAQSVTDLIRYAQVWSVEGESLLRSQFMTTDLPVAPDALAAAEGGEIVWRTVEYEGRPVRAVYYPLDRFGLAHREHILQVAAPLARRNEMLERTALLLAIVTISAGIVTYWGSWWLAGRAVRPVYEVIDQAEEIGASSLDRRIDAYADATEYRRLVEVLNTMLARIQRAYDAQERFAADASHELRSPLTALRGEIEVALRREREPQEYRATLESALEEIERLTRITSELLAAARAQADPGRGGSGRRGAEADVDVRRLARVISDRVLSKHLDRALTVEVSLEGVDSAPVDSTALSQVLWNLVENAARFSPRGGRIDVGLEVRPGRVGVRVSDRGPGLGDDPDRIFERFYRADAVRTPGSANGNTGLGLAIVRTLAENSGGSVHGHDRPGGGAVVEVILGTERTVPSTIKQRIVD